MSPMSRWPRNWTPLTTRPSATSRQGMILAAGIQRLAQAEAALPKCLADNRTRGATSFERKHVVDTCDSARSLKFDAGVARQERLDQWHIGAGKHTVARN